MAHRNVSILPQHHSAPQPARLGPLLRAKVAKECTQKRSVPVFLHFIGPWHHTFNMRMNDQQYLMFRLGTLIVHTHELRHEKSNY